MLGQVIVISFFAVFAGVSFINFYRINRVSSRNRFQGLVDLSHTYDNSDIKKIGQYFNYILYSLLVFIALLIGTLIVSAQLS
ncbi:MAG TPA: hypothetical protein VHK91_04720 [Flavisolibacter sp.]|jgi:hypothetical protein|nr:hypothetical protein [Flavisolibacter sp.]